MKYKMISLVLALFLSVCFLPNSLADSVPIPCQLVEAVDWSANEWISTPENRAFLTVLFLFEMETGNIISIDDYYASESIVCKNDDVLSIAICGKKNSIMIFYRPSIHYASYLVMEQYTVDTLKSSLDHIYEEVYINTTTAMQEALELLETIYNSGGVF